MRKMKKEESIGKIKKTNKKLSLEKIIFKLLSDNPNGLSDRELTTLVKDSGYVTKSKNFLSVIRVKLYKLVQLSRLVKIGNQYQLNNNLVAEKVKSTAKQLQLNYQLLQQAIVDYAKVNGLKNPEKFPDILIQERQKFLQAENSYMNLLSKK